MSVGAFTLYDSVLEALARGQLGDLSTSPVSAVLLDALYTPDVTGHRGYADISSHAVTSPDYAPAALVSGEFSVAGNVVSFTSNPISFGTSVTILGARYAVLVAGNATSLVPADQLIGFMDLSTSGGTVQSRNSSFVVSPALDGWFRLQKGVTP